VGLSEDEARAARYKIHVLRWPYSENDRAQTERQTLGHIKVVTSDKGRILGATIAGANAGELIHVWSLAVAQRLHIKAMADYIAPDLTLGEIGKRAALRHYATLPANTTLRKLIDFVARLG
jgi:pyruvate/2-oxoglutarate dehydrogenase complex dihydrolipoamide dehydrogenase (E3) component